METVLKGAGREIVLAPGRPTVIIGNRISAGENAALSDLLRRGDWAAVGREAQAQVDAGAGIVLVNVCGEGIDEREALALAVGAVAAAVPVPICIEAADPQALEAALAACPGKPLVGWVTGDERRLAELLPVAMRRGAAVVGTAADASGIPRQLEARIDLARHVLRQCVYAGLPRNDVLIDPGLGGLDEDPDTALNALKAARYLAQVDDVNLCLKPAVLQRNVPDSAVVAAMATLAIGAGAGGLFLDPVKAKSIVDVADVLMGRPR